MSGGWELTPINVRGKSASFQQSLSAEQVDIDIHIRSEFLSCVEKGRGIRADDMIVASRLFQILHDEDPEAFVTPGASVMERLAIDGHWELPVVVSRLRAEIGVVRRKSAK